MIVFGESTLNDAVSIALSNSVAEINTQISQGQLPDYKHVALYGTGHFFLFFFGSMLLGLAISAFSSLLFKKLDLHKFTWIEVSLFGILSYLPYILAEYFELSGILAIFVAGLIMRDWTFYSLGPLGKITVEFFIETTGYISENFVFAYLGISIPLMMVNLQWPLVFIGCFALMVSRTVSVFIVSFVINIFKKERIPFSHQIVMSYGGLRGAVAFYL
jgi:NhaP-type Na+/H+ or K+/H+ antiporter